MDTYEISCISDYLSCIKNIWKSFYPKNDPVVTVWYRGVNDTNYKLLPGAYWRKKCDEESMINTFYTMLPSYSKDLPSNDWDWYFSMQHYGLPTRLLDWTENPLFALYFALSNPKRNKIPCVWALEPTCLNKASCGPKEDWVYVPGGDSIKTYLPEYCGRGMKIISQTDPEMIPSNEFPIAIFPNRSNSRLVAQRGVFTIHGINEIPIEEHLNNNKYNIKPLLAKILIKKNKTKEIFQDIFNIGIDVFQLFPEPDKISQYAKEYYSIK